MRTPSWFLGHLGVLIIRTSNQMISPIMYDSLCENCKLACSGLYFTWNQVRHGYKKCIGKFHIISFHVKSEWKENSKQFHTVIFKIISTEVAYCGKFRFFLLLGFYVKPILANVESQKSSFMKNLKLLKLHIRLS